MKYSAKQLKEINANVRFKYVNSYASPNYYGVIVLDKGPKHLPVRDWQTTVWLAARCDNANPQKQAREKMREWILNYAKQERFIFDAFVLVADDVKQARYHVGA